MPVLVMWDRPWVSSGASIGSGAGPATLVVSTTSVNEGSLLFGAHRLSGLGAGLGAVVGLVVVVLAALFVHRRLHDPAVDAGDDADRTGHGEPQAVDEAVGDERQAERDHDRPVRR